MSYSTHSFNRIEFPDGVLYPDGRFVPIDPLGVNIF